MRSTICACVAAVLAAGCTQGKSLTDAMGPDNTLGLGGSQSMAISVSPTTVSGLIGDSVRLGATLKDEKGNSVRTQGVAWNSGDTTVATVSVGGMVHLWKSGSTQITATSAGAVANAPVTVNGGAKAGDGSQPAASAQVGSVVVAPASVTVAQGKTAQVAATVLDGGGNTSLASTVTWTSSNPGVATVSSTGLATAVAAGAAVITASSGGKSASAHLTVTSVAATIASVRMSPAFVLVAKGRTAQLTATLLDGTGSTIAGRTVTWTSSKPSVVTVSSSGMVTAVAVGTSVITASSAGRSGTVALTVRAAGTTGPGEPARASDSFVESIGVAMHIRYVVNGPQYATILKPRLLESGIRYIRDGGTGSPFFADLNDLATYGIHSTLVMDPRDGIDPSTMVSKAIEPIINSVVAVEGPNEWDDDQSMTWQGQSFPAGLRAYQTALYAAVKNSSDPAVQRIQVLSPSMAHPKNAITVGPVPCDMGNLHSYPGGALPENQLSSMWIPDTKEMSGNQPVVATETGYNYNLTSGMAGQPGVSDLAMAKYAPRTYLEYFNQGVYRTHIYNLSTDENGWGMLHADGTPKAPFYSIKNTITLLADRGGASFTPGAVSYSFTGDTTHLHHTLLGKRNGRYYLILWLDVSSYNTSARQDISTTRNLTLSVQTPFNGANVYMPRQSTTPVAQATGQPTAVQLTVSDDPMIVELVP